MATTVRRVKPRYNRGSIALPSKVGMAGVDDRVDLDRLCYLSMMYDIEWGVLLHPEKYGQKRYMSRMGVLHFNNWVERIKEIYDEGTDDTITTQVRCSAHLCGDYVDMLLEDGYIGIEQQITQFRTIQVNLCGRKIKTDESERVDAWARHYNKSIVMQVDEFPYDDNYTYLLDRSRGKGVHPNSWPNPQRPFGLSERGRDYYRDHHPGFAGGITPDNILDTCGDIQQHTSYYFIDMESGLRDEDNEFDLGKAKLALNAIYGNYHRLPDGRLVTDEEEGHPEYRSPTERRRTPQVRDDWDEFIEIEEGQ